MGYRWDIAPLYSSIKLWNIDVLSKWRFPFWHGGAPVIIQLSSRFPGSRKVYWAYVFRTASWHQMGIWSKHLNWPFHGISYRSIFCHLIFHRKTTADHMPARPLGRLNGLWTAEASATPRGTTLSQHVEPGIFGVIKQIRKLLNQ